MYNLYIHRYFSYVIYFYGTHLAMRGINLLFHLGRIHTPRYNLPTVAIAAVHAAYTMQLKRSIINIITLIVVFFFFLFHTSSYVTVLHLQTRRMSYTYDINCATVRAVHMCRQRHFVKTHCKRKLSKNKNMAGKYEILHFKQNRSRLYFTMYNIIVTLFHQSVK